MHACMHAGMRLGIAGKLADRHVCLQAGRHGGMHAGQTWRPLQADKHGRHDMHACCQAGMHVWHVWQVGRQARKQDMTDKHDRHA